MARFVSDDAVVGNMGNIQQIYPKGHEKFLPQDAVLWRYVPLKTLFFYLAGNIFIPSIAKLQQGDPFEGKYLFDTKDFEAALRQTCGKQFGVVQKWIRRALWSAEEKHFMKQNKAFPV